MTPPRDPVTGRFLPRRKPTEAQQGRSGKAALIEAMQREVSPEDWQTITHDAKRKALDGDEKNRQWLADHLLGRPAVHIPEAPPVEEVHIVVIWGEGDDEPESGPPGLPTPAG